MTIQPAPDRPIWQMSRFAGVYQMLLRRAIEHFLPDSTLEPVGDRSIIAWEGNRVGVNYRIGVDADGLGLEIEWFRTQYQLLPASPTPFSPGERKLAESILRVLDERYQTFFDLSSVDKTDLFHYALEDLVIAEYLDPPEPDRLPAALEALRAAALTTYENRRVTTGAILLGTENDPAHPDRPNSKGAPSYNIRLAAIKGFHRLCDGARTAFLVDLQGDIARAVDVGRWADQVQGPGRPEIPCPNPYGDHARATRSGGHVGLVLTPAQEIKIFAGGVMAFAHSDARWRLLDIPTKFNAWTEAVGPTRPTHLARIIFEAALNLMEARTGALFVVLRDPEVSIPRLVAPADRIGDEVLDDDPTDPDNLSPRLAKRARHHVVRGQGLADLAGSVLESIAGIDGAVVTDRDGRLITFGAILRVAPETLKVARAVEGARTLAGLAASYDGPVLKVSEDGFLTMFLGGRRVWEM